MTFIGCGSVNGGVNFESLMLRLTRMPQTIGSMLGSRIAT
jgi:hypothetical protein